MRIASTYNSDEWSRYAETECTKGLLAKFDQNPKLKTILLNTGSKTLVECSWDKIWGTGYPLSQPECLDAENWKSPGLLGTLLMAAREKIKAKDTGYSILPLPSLKSKLPTQTYPPPLPDHMETDSIASAAANKWKLNNIPSYTTEWFKICKSLRSHNMWHYSILTLSDCASTNITKLYRMFSCHYQVITYVITKL